MTAFFETYVPTDDKLESCPHIVLKDVAIEWEPNGIKMSSNGLYGDNESSMVWLVQSARHVCQKRQLKPVEYKNDLVLGSVCGSLVMETASEWLVS